MKIKSPEYLLLYPDPGRLQGLLYLQLSFDPIYGLSYPIPLPLEGVAEYLARTIAVIPASLNGERLRLCSELLVLRDLEISKFSVPTWDGIEGQSLPPCQRQRYER